MIPDNNILGCISPVEGAFLTYLSSRCKTGSIVHIGCFKGRSLRYLLDGHPTPPVKIYAIDLNVHSKALQENVIAHDNNNQIIIVQGSSIDTNTLDQIPSDISLIFIDGDHSKEGALSDLTNYWNKTGPGAVFVLHDTFDVNGVLCQPSVSSALTEFLSTHADQCVSDDFYENCIHRVDTCAVFVKKG